MIRQYFFDPLIETFTALRDYTQTQLMTTLRRHNIHWEQLLDRARIIFTNMKAADHWKWAESKDSKASPNQFFLNEIVCNGCGKEDVKKPDCPVCKKKKGENEKKGDKEQGDKNKKKGGLGSDAHPALKDNEQPIKVVDNCVYFWCPKCKRWESTHLPKDHGKQNTKLMVDQLIEIKKQFVATSKPPADFSFCQIISDEGVNL